MKFEDKWNYVKNNIMLQHSDRRNPWSTFERSVAEDAVALQKNQKEIKLLQQIQIAAFGYTA